MVRCSAIVDRSFAVLVGSKCANRTAAVVFLSAWNVDLRVTNCTGLLSRAGVHGQAIEAYVSREEELQTQMAHLQWRRMQNENQIRQVLESCRAMRKQDVVAQVRVRFVWPLSWCVRCGWSSVEPCSLMLQCSGMWCGMVVRMSRGTGL